MKIDLLALVSIAATLCFVAFNAKAADCESSIIATEKVVGFSGCISDESARAFLSATNARTELVVLRSMGGSVSAALKMANAIAANNLRVIVRGMCLSSCANYLMPAASSVFVEQDSLIGFHGDSRLTSGRRKRFDRDDRELSEVIDRINKEEAEFSSGSLRASRVHDIQSVALAPNGELISVRLGDDDLLCPGQGLSIWFPMLHLLKELGLIDKVIEHDEALLPQIIATLPKELIGISRSSISPLLKCEIKGE